MGERYWVRHETLSGPIGPLGRDEIAAALRAQSLPADCEVLPDIGQGAAAAAVSPGWQGIAERLGLGTAKAPQPPPTKPPRPRREPTPDDIRDAVRAKSAYAPFRRLLDTAVAVLTVIAVVAFLAGVSQVSGGGAPLLFAGLAAQVVVLLLGRHLAQMIADIADCALRRDADASRD